MKASLVLAVSALAGTGFADLMHLFYQNCNGVITPKFDVTDSSGKVTSSCDLAGSPSDILCFSNGYVPHIFESEKTGCNGNDLPTDSEIAAPGVGGWHIWYPHNSTNCKGYSYNCDRSQGDCFKSGWECDLSKGGN